MDGHAAYDELADFVAGSLPAATNERLLLHFSLCSECRQRLALMRRLAGLPAENAAGPIESAHVPSEWLAELSLHPDQFDQRRRELVLQHLRECVDCRADYDLARGPSVVRSPDAEPQESRGGFSRYGSWPALAAAAVLVLLAYPSYLGLARYPVMRRELLATQSKLEHAREAAGPPRTLEPPATTVGDAGAGGAAAVLALAGTMRGSAGRRVYVPRTGQAFLPLQLDCDLSPARFAGENPNVIVSIVDSESLRDLWSFQRPAAGLWDSDNRCVSLLVPVSALRPGVLAITVTTVAAPRRVLMRASFTMEPPATH